MVVNLVRRVKQAINTGVRALRHHIAASTKPTNSSLVRGSLQDLVRSKPQLIAENALLRQQLIVLNRSVKRPCLTATDRSLLVLLASRLRTWKDALLIVNPTRCCAGIGRAFACSGDGSHGQAHVHRGFPQRRSP